MQRLSAFVMAMVVAAGLLAASGAAWAQGFGVYEQSACMTGRGGAGVAAPCADASGVYFNPAGLSFDATEISLGGALIGPRGDFTDNASRLVTPLTKKWYPAPNIYFSTPIGKRFAVGLGVFAPYGLTTDWPETSEGRFLGYKSVVQGVYVQPTVAVKLNDKVMVGGGVDVTYLNVELRQRVDLAAQLLPNGVPFTALGVRPGTDFGNVQLKGHNYSTGFHIGLLAKANERVSIGLRWMTGQKVDIKNGKITTTQISAVKPDGSKYLLPISIPGVAPAGTPLDLLLAPQFASGGKLSNQNATSRIPLPDQIVAGVALQAAANLRFLVDYQFTRWSMFDVLPINGDFLKKDVTESYQNTSGVRIGVEVTVAKHHVLRAGFDGHGAAAPAQTVTPNLPEGPRQEYAVGFGSQLSPKVRFDVAYMYLHQPERAGRTGDGGKAVPTTAENNGVYSFKANIFNAALSLRF